ncbi:MAG: uroporphyrinogen-III synthase [Asticcacaulis sp.]
MIGDIKPVVWITRTRDGAERTATEVARRGFEPLIAPVLQVTPLAPQIDAGHFDALILTSGNAAAPLSVLIHRRDMPVFCTGDATALAARHVGFTNVKSAHGDVRALFELIRGAVAKSARLLYAAPRQPAAPLTQWLSDEGYGVQQAAVYETRTIDPELSDDDFRRITHVLVHSPRAGEAVARAVAERTRHMQTGTLTFICISEAAWRAADDKLTEAGMKIPLRIDVVPRISRFPDVASMLDLLG